MVFTKISKEEFKNVKKPHTLLESFRRLEIFQFNIKKLGKNENYLILILLRSEVLNLIPNFTELNELPKFK